jgi:UDPglucose 6-dehydrogenase
MNICIIGTGYVGLVTGAAFAFLGNKVSCVDVDEKKVALLKQGQLPIYEPGLDQLIELSGNRIQFNTSYSSAVSTADIIFIAVGTPTGPDGHPNLSYVQQAAQEIGRHLGDHFTVIVNKSTVPIGCGNWVDSLVRETGADKDFSIASNPEFLKEGSAISDSLYPDRIVVGSQDNRSLALLAGLYRPLLNQDFQPPAFLPRPDGLAAAPLVTTDIASAEMIKYAANAFLTVKIGFINEMASLSERVGADITQIARGLGLDSRIGQRFLQAGIGWGGSCFGKDTAALVSTSGEYGLRLPIVEASREVNCRQRERMVEKLQHELKILKGRNIGILGIAFKPNTDDLRDSPALDLARRLLALGARVSMHDPISIPRAIRETAHLKLNFCHDSAGVFDASDGVILATDWKEYRSLDYQSLLNKMRSPILLDARNFLDGAAMSAAGYRYLGVGR